MNCLKEGAVNITLRPRLLLFQLFLVAALITLVFYSGIGRPHPSIKRTRWYNEDLESVFNVTYLPFAIDDPRVENGVKKALDRHDVRNDKQYDKRQQSNYAQWAKFMDHGPTPNDKSVYIARAGGKGHGVFAGRLLKAGEFISVYTGVRVFKTEDRDSTYMWSYKLFDEHGDKLHLDTDSRLSGNMMRFVNDNPGGRGRNCHVVQVPYKNRWLRVYMVGSKDILPGEELTISYGDGYWENRKFV
jgi:hypothetical protein